MGFLSLALALVLEQWRPLAARRSLFELAERYAAFFERQFNAGEAQHGIIAWTCAVAPPVLLAWLAYAVLAHLGGLFALAFNVAVLYLTLGFRQFSHYFTDIHLAMKEGDLGRARQRGEPPAMLSIIPDDSRRACSFRFADATAWYSKGYTMAPAWRNEVTLRSVEWARAM